MYVKTHDIQFQDGQTVKVSEEAGVYLAAHVAQVMRQTSNLNYRSHDDLDNSNVNNECSFVSKKFEEK